MCILLGGRVMKAYLKKALQAFFILVVITGLINTGCATAPVKPIVQLTDPTERISFQGASFLPPGEDWFTAYQHKNKALFTRVFLNKPAAKAVDLHTIAAEATTTFVDVDLKDRNEIIEHIKEERQNEKMEDRFRSIELKISLDNSLGYDCMRDDRKVEDRGVPQFLGEVFILEAHNLTCPHPDYPWYVIVLTYSQRYHAESQPIPIDVEGELFLKGLKFEKLERPFVAAEIQVGRGPQAVTFGHNAVWVAAGGSNTVSRIDPISNKVTQTIAVGKEPVGVIVSDDAVWAANMGDGTVSRIDPATNKVITAIKVGRSPLLLSAGEGSIWVTNSLDNTVSRINPQTNEVIATIKVGKGPSGVAVGAGAVWVANFKSNTVSRIDPKINNLVATIRVGKGANSLIIDKGAVWVSNQNDWTLSRIDPETNKVVATFRVGRNPSGLAAANGFIWVANWGEDTIYRIDPATNQVIGKPIPVGSKPLIMAIGEGSVWVSNVWDGTIMRIKP